MSTTEKAQWSPIQGHRGFFSKAAEAPDMLDPSIRRAVEELNRQFAAIDDDVDRQSSEKYSLYGFGQKP